MPTIKPKRSEGLRGAAATGASPTNAGEHKAPASPARQGSTRKLPRTESAHSMEHDDAQPVEVKRVPVDQVKDLTPEQLNEVFTKAITATNPNVPKATTRFHFREGAFKLDGTVEHLTVHFSMESSLVFADSNEARQQPADEAKAAGGDAAPLGGGGNSAERRSVGTSPALEGAAAAGAAAPADGAAEAGGEPHSPVTKDKKLRNQFNFNERSMRTVNNPLRDREVMTEPPPTRDYSGSVTQWGIFDQYLSDLKAQIAAKEQKEREQGGRFAQGSSSETDSKAVSAAVLPPNGALAAERERLMKSPGFAHAIKILERMVTQNEQDDTFRDFKYFEDEQDTLREDARGELLPLWRFLFAEAKRKTVTSLCWNPVYSDLFAVGYGSYDFQKQGSGLVCLFSLKNSTHPEVIIPTPSGVMTIDFHPEHPWLIAVGLYDGSVAVYDVRRKNAAPLYASTDPQVKHTDPVWQVRWEAAHAVATDAEGPTSPTSKAKVEAAKATAAPAAKPRAGAASAGSAGRAGVGKVLNFFSVSSDGRVTNWILSKNELVHEEVAELRLVQRTETAPSASAASLGSSSGATAAAKDEDDDVLAGLAGGSCIDFSPHNQSQFVVGTEEGGVALYSKAYVGQLQESFDGHHLSVYSLRWNPFHPRVFLSCSADWTIKLWEVGSPKPIMSFDLSNPVGDVAWAPYSSTVFAAITSDGRLRVFDLNVNKHEPIGESRVVKKAKLTRLSFNPKEPVVLVGDDAGAVMSLKLSPNLRKMAAPSIDDLDRKNEVDKLERLLVYGDRDPKLARARGAR